MLFVQFRFIVFFLIVFAVHWALQSNRARKIWLLICSLFFYACLFLGGPESPTMDTFPPVEFVRRILEGRPLPTGWWFPVVLLGSITMDFFVGIGMGNAKTERARKICLLVSVIVNLSVLGFFKYANFCIDSVHAALSWFGLHTSKATLNIFLPFGISFYTFQSMSYSIDVYRRQLKPVRNFFDLAFFISFFPQLVAGPIVRAMTFLPQIPVRREWKNVDVRGCLTLFFIGFVKKTCVSENIAPIVDAFFAAPGNYDIPSSFAGVLLYAVQVYCDFSGYSDMAIASAGLLDYKLTENFNFPYFSGNIAEHWRRWHISLSTWLRDYLYIPLGGNRGSKFISYRNLTLTMVIGGLWHGASWTYVIWGLLQGLCLCAHREYKDLANRAPGWWQRARTIIGPPLTFYFTCTAYCFFRGQDVVNAETGQVTPGYEIAWTAVKSFVFFQKNGDQSFGSLCLWVFAGLAVVHWLAYRKVFSTWWRVIPAWLYTVLLAIGVNIALYFLPQHHKAFIYFQF